jgi:hydrogenase maturation protease
VKVSKTHTKGIGGSPPLVIGLGNDDRGDDGCGLEALRRLKKRVLKGVQFKDCQNDATALIDLWDGADIVIVVDAVQSGKAPGTIVRIEVGSEPLASPLGSTSTHGLSLADAVSIGQSLKRFPRKLVIYGIEATDFTLGTGLTTSVARAVEDVVDRIASEIAHVSPAGGE